MDNWTKKRKQNSELKMTKIKITKLNYKEK